MIKSSIVMFVLISFIGCAYAGDFSQLTDALLTGNYKEANAQVELLYKNRSIVTSAKVKELMDLEKLTSILDSIDEFNASAQGYISNPNSKNISFSSLNYKYPSLPKSSWIAPQSIVDLLNSKLSLANKNYDKAKAIHAKLIETQKAKKRAAEIAMQKKWEKEEADRKANIKRMADARKAKAASKEHKYNLHKQKIEEEVKKIGYKGLYVSGIANFLYAVKQGSSFNKSNGYVLWSKISPNDSIGDKQFKAKQLFNGNIVYSFTIFKNYEPEEFTIMVPRQPNDSFIQGQVLRHKCYVFSGNREYQTVLGSTNTIPVFKPVIVDGCQ